MTLFVAEISSNHNGDLERCRRTIAAAAGAGCGAVKFQLFRIEKLFAREILRVSAAHRLRRRWELPPWFLPELAACAHDHGLRFGCTPFDLEAVKLLEPHADFLKIASYELCWLPLIARCARTGLPLMISTGMATAREIQAAVTAAVTAGCRDLSLLHCVSSYPAAPDRCNLAAIASLGRLAEPLAGTATLRCGWSDHSANAGVVTRAIRRWNAEVVEFHFDLDGQGQEFGAGHCWLPPDIAPVIKGATTGADQACDGNGRFTVDDQQAAERAWRADPSDGLRPTLAVRRSWPADQPGAHPSGGRLLLIPAGAGWGHLTRCIALAESLRARQDADPVFLAAEDSGQTALLDRHGLPWLGMPSAAADLPPAWRQSLRHQLGALVPTGLNGAVVDTQADPAPVTAILGAAGLPTVLIDQPRAPAGTLGIVPSLTWSPPRQADDMLGGPTFLFVREDVRVLRPPAPPPGADGPLLITFGGTDPHRLTERCLLALAGTLPEVRALVVIGPGFEDRDQRLDHIRSRYPQAEVIPFAAGLERLLAAAGLVVTALGVTVGEAMCLGAPCAVLGFRPQDEAELVQLEQAGLIASLGLHPDVADLDLGRRLAAVWHDSPRRSTLAQAGWHFCDGLGTERAAAAIAAWLDGREAGAC